VPGVFRVSSWNKCVLEQWATSKVAARQHLTFERSKILPRQFLINFVNEAAVWTV
jgi:hypothetical protein